MDEDYPANFDIIFCRNVTIYFELETTLKVMEKLYGSLLDDGYLFIGYSETLQFMPDKFSMVADHDAIYYRKSMVTEKAPAGALLPQEEGIDKVLEEISLKQLQAELEAEKNIPAPSKNLEELMLEAIKLTHLKDYTKALRLLEEAVSTDKKAPDPYYLAAEIMLNQGKPEEARKKLETVLKINPMFAPAHYLLGCVCLQEGNLEGAKDNLKKSIYIDKDFLLARFYIAQAFREEGKVSSAIKEFRNTAKLLSAKTPDEIIPYSGGFNAATLMSVCRDNLERLKASG
jgi:chemotaxis protein methyltransferase CheR